RVVGDEPFERDRFASEQCLDVPAHAPGEPEPHGGVDTDMTSTNASGCPQGAESGAFSANAYVMTVRDERYAAGSLRRFGAREDGALPCPRVRIGARRGR